jgi:hypothetical protein
MVIMILTFLSENKYILLRNVRVNMSIEKNRHQL